MTDENQPETHTVKSLEVLDLIWQCRLLANAMRKAERLLKLDATSPETKEALLEAGEIRGDSLEMMRRIGESTIPADVTN